MSIVTRCLIRGIECTLMVTRKAHICLACGEVIGKSSWCWRPLKATRRYTCWCQGCANRIGEPLK